MLRRKGKEKQKLTAAEGKGTTYEKFPERAGRQTIQRKVANCL